MKRIILLLISFISINLFAAKHNHFDENEVRYIKQNYELEPQYQQLLRNGSLWQDFIANNDGWFVIFNERNRLPHRAFGTPIPVTDLQTFFSVNNFILPNDLRENTFVKNDKYINKTYRQYYNDLEVIGSKVYAKFTHNNELIAFGLDVFNDINISSVPILDVQSAISSATSNILNPITNVVVNDDLKVLANPKYRKYEYHLVYEISFSTKIGDGPANYICYVDANDGELLMRKNTVLYEAPPSGTATVSGEVYTSHSYNPSSNQNYRYLKAIDQSSNTDYFTDNNGEVFLPMPLGTEVRYKLEGLYADVQTDGDTPDIFEDLSATNIISFNNNATMQERTAYWAVNQIHDHLKVVFPTYDGLDFPMETNIDETGSCNAFWNGSSINFYEEGGGCHATGQIPDVVYHEYGHAINSFRYNSTFNGPGMWNGALNEGFADIWALSLTQSPILGIGFYLNDPGGFVRRYDQNIKVYPQDLVGQVHNDGEIIAGAFWDLYLNLNNMTQMLDLFKYTYDSGIDGSDGDEGILYTDILLEVLYADDNDADLSNGTPNDMAIIGAFDLHGITLLSNAVIAHNPVNTANSNAGIAITASVGITYPWALGSTNCFYRLNNANSWINLPMSGTSSFSGTIPAQPSGTIVAYYLSLTDNFGNEAAVNPIAANINPMQYANLPHFIMVGYDLLEEEDFDANFGFWQTGGVDDNASTGLWEIGTPIGSFTDNGSIVQTDADNTPAGFQCAFTQNAASSSLGIGDSDVDEGHTTLYSPYYDLSSYTNPAFSYYRWYTNNTGAEPNADWWQVMITDDGVNWQYVENNLTSDISWRKFAFRVTDYVNLTPDVQLKFIASDSANGALSAGSLVEAAVDDLMLYEEAVATSNSDILEKPAKLIKITDLLGREVSSMNLVDEKTLLYIYDDGRVERKIIFD